MHGEELAYVLGMPLVGGTYHFVHNYTHQVMVVMVGGTYHFVHNYNHQVMVVMVSNGGTGGNGGGGDLPLCA